MKTLATLLLLLPLATACASGPSKSELDAEVKRLCAIDGGIKVYETVTLPAEKFNKYGQINFYKPTQGENALGVEYLYKRETTNSLHGNAEIRRDHIKIIRRSDGKLLGEFIHYVRAGGDMPGPWHDSTYHCPDLTNSPNFESAIFIKENTK